MKAVLPDEGVVKGGDEDPAWVVCYKLLSIFNTLIESLRSIYNFNKHISSYVITRHNKILCIFLKMQYFPARTSLYFYIHIYTSVVDLVVGGF